MMMFVMLYSVVLPFESVDEILQQCNHSNESYLAVCSVVLFCFSICPKSVRSVENLLNLHFTVL